MHLIANLEAGEMMDLIYEVPQEDIHHETEDHAQINSTEDGLT